MVTGSNGKATPPISIKQRINDHGYQNNKKAPGIRGRQSRRRKTVAAHSLTPDHRKGTNFG
jgi:hypothetical protein